MMIAAWLSSGVVNGGTIYTVTDLGAPMLPVNIAWAPSGVLLGEAMILVYCRKLVTACGG